MTAPLTGRHDAHPSATPEWRHLPRHIFLTVPEVFDRYGWKRSHGYQQIAAPGFPPRIGNKFRLDLLMAWEDAIVADRLTADGAAGASPDSTRRDEQADADAKLMNRRKKQDA